MNIETKRIISVREIEKELNMHFTAFEFAQMAENGSYVELFCNDDARKELVEDLEWYAGKGAPIYDRLRNQLTLVDTLRYTYGIFDSVLIYVSW